MADIDNVTNSEDNNNQASIGENENPAAGVSAPEDTTGKAYETIIETKDSIISAYEKQVESLQSQIANLVRNGASVVERNENDNAASNDQTQKRPLNYMGGFGKGIDAYENGFDVKSLGLEIGKHDD